MMHEFNIQTPSGCNAGTLSVSSRLRPPSSRQERLSRYKPNTTIRNQIVFRCFSDDSQDLRVAVGYNPLLMCGIFKLLKFWKDFVKGS
jgi:hypothetical protein